MTVKKQNPLSSRQRKRAKLEQKLKVIEAQIARLERDLDLGLATRDHFIVWKRSCLFAAWQSGIQ
jgi:hypothetical protein